MKQTAQQMVNAHLEKIVKNSIESTHEIYLANYGSFPPIDQSIQSHVIKRRFNSISENLSSSLNVPAPLEQESFKVAETPSTALVKKLTESSIPKTKAQTALVQIKEARKVPTPEWHAPWKLMRVISGHLGPVRCVAVDSSNEWFVTGGGDRMV